MNGEPRYINNTKEVILGYKTIMFLSGNTISFKEAFENRDEIFSFLSYLLRNKVTDIRIYNQFGVEVEIDEMIGETTFGFSDDAINVIGKAFERLHGNRLSILSDETSKTVSFLVPGNNTIQ